MHGLPSSKLRYSICHVPGGMKSEAKMFIGLLSVRVHGSAIQDEQAQSVALSFEASNKFFSNSNTTTFVLPRLTVS